MKRRLLLLCVLLCLFAFCACGKEEPSPEQPLLGGWQDAQRRDLTDETRGIYAAAAASYGAALPKPTELLATQVVAGVNYKFLCEGEAPTDGTAPATYTVVIYRDLKGNCTVTSVTENPGNS